MATRELEPGKAFTRLQRELEPFTANPTGVGLDVPQWLRRLAEEVESVRAAQTAIGVLAEGLLQVPRRDLTIDQVRDLSEKWETPLDPQ